MNIWALFIIVLNSFESRWDPSSLLLHALLLLSTDKIPSVLLFLFYYFCIKVDAHLVINEHKLGKQKDVHVNIRVKYSGWQIFFSFCLDVGNFVNSIFFALFFILTNKGMNKQAFKYRKSMVLRLNYCYKKKKFILFTWFSKLNFNHMVS